MKRIFLILLAGIFLCACVPTPDEPIVVGKDQSAMIEQAKATIAPKLMQLSIRERLDVPERLKYSYHKGKVSIEADAKIVVPDGELPIVRVYPTNFDQQTVTNLWNVLIGDMPMTAKQNADTKDVIAARMQTLMTAIDNNDLERYHFSSVEEAEQAIEVLKSTYQAAPEAAAGETVDAALQRGVQLDDHGKEVASHTYLSAVSEEMGIHFSVNNSWNNKETIIGTAYDEYGRAVGTTVRQVVSGSDFSFYKQNESQIVCYIWERELSFSDGCPEECKGSVTITPAEAKALAEDFLAQSGMDSSYRASRIFLIRDQENTVYSYRVVCAHTVNGCETLMPANLIEVDAEDDYAPIWKQERFTVDVNDNGVYNINLDSPIAIGDTITEQSNLLPYREMFAIMKKMLPIVYADYEDDLDYAVRINRAELGLWRIRVQDKIDQGMLIPVWAFYGYVRTYASDMPEYGEMNSYEPILLINAVDGSIIDPIKGY